ncbi:hypothetical protein BJV78DRAFT_446201 [Lactifluus subvellereus]|nr:hypothetical protein BJV78DRAFT_446201 [Lactifluus subvellereus]
MPGGLRDTKLTDFFQRRPSLSGSCQASSQQQATLVSFQSASSGDSRPLAAPRRKPGRPKGSGKKAKDRHDQGLPTLSKRTSLPHGTGEHPVPQLSASCPSPLGSSSSNLPAKRQTGKPKGERKKAVVVNKDAYPLHSSLKAGPRHSHNIVSTSPLNSAARHRSKVPSSSQEKSSSSSRVFTPSKRKPDDNDDTASSTTSSGVPLSLSYTPRQLSSPGSSMPSMSPLPTLPSSQPSNKRRRYTSPRTSRTLQGPVTPKKTRGDEEIVPTSQSSEVGVYTPVRPNSVSRPRNDAQESVDNWRHGRSAYRCEIVSPLRFAPEGDYSMEIDRPLSPLTSCPQSASLGSPLSSFTDLDVHSEVEPDDLPLSLPLHALPSPSSSVGEAHLALTQTAILSPLRPVTPPPSSPEQEQPTPAPVVPKDPKTRTAEIIAEIWADVRAKSVSDSEDSYLHAPIKDELSSEEEDDEPFWKRDKASARRAIRRSATAEPDRTRPRPSLPSPFSPSPSPLSMSLDEPSFTKNNRHVPDFPVSELGSPLDDMPKRSTRTRRPITRVTKPSAPETKPGARKACPIKAMLRERKKEARVGGGIDAVNRAEGYDHDTLLSDFSIDEADEGVDNAVPKRSSTVDKNSPRVASTSLQTDRVDMAPNSLEIEVHQEERKRLLGAKEGEAVGKILDADRKLGQTIDDSVLGVSVFVSSHEGTVDVDGSSKAGPVWMSAKGKTATLDKLSEAIEQQDVEYLQAVFSILSVEDMVIPGVAQWLCKQALWYEHEHLGRLSRKFLLEMPLWAQSYPGSPLTVDLIVHTLMGLGLRKDLSTLVLPPQDATFPRLQNRLRVLGSMVKMISSFAPRWSMEQLPDVVIVLLLIGVDMDTSTELKRDILHSVSLLCRQLPAKSEGPEDTEISVAQKALDLAKSLSASNQALLLSFFTKGSPSSLRIARAVAYHVLTSSIIQPVSCA